jgi:hypothetical protein
MLKERPELTKAVEQIAAGIGYRIQSGVDEDALKEWHLNYTDHSGIIGVRSYPFCKILLLENPKVLV